MWRGLFPIVGCDSLCNFFPHRPGLSEKDVFRDCERVCETMSKIRTGAVLGASAPVYDYNSIRTGGFGRSALVLAATGDTIHYHPYAAIFAESAANRSKFWVSSFRVSRLWFKREKKFHFAILVVGFYEYVHFDSFHPLTRLPFERCSSSSRDWIECYFNHIH